jgi:hypothetical protein
MAAALQALVLDDPATVSLRVGVDRLAARGEGAGHDAVDAHVVGAELAR